MASLSDLPKTWLIDIDGVIFPHNEYLGAPEEKPLPGVLEFFNQIPLEDKVILLTARKPEYLEQTQRGLHSWGIRYDELVIALPVGERILINDIKPGGLETAHAVNLKRNEGLANLSSILRMNRNADATEPRS